MLVSALTLCCSAKMKSAFRDWSDVRVFLAVVRAGSTLAASKTLGIAQPTVARRIEALEHALGLVLFDRNTRGFQPTAEAQELIAKAEALETAATDFAEQAVQLIVGKSRTIRVTGYTAAFNHRFASVIEAFVSSYGDVKFEFLPSNEVLDLAGGEADVALRICSGLEDPTLICRKVRDIGFSLFASKSYAAMHPLPASETDFAGHRFIVQEGRSYSNPFNTWLLDRIGPDQIAMACERVAAMETAVLMGLGIGPLPTNLRHTNDNFIECFAMPPEASLQVWLLVNHAAYRRPEVKAFASFFVPRYRALFKHG